MNFNLFSNCESVNSFSNFIFPLLPIAWHISGLSIIYSIFSANNSGEFFSTINPDILFSIILGIPPSFVAMHGILYSIASSSTSPNASFRVGNTKRSAFSKKSFLSFPYLAPCANMILSSFKAWILVVKKSSDMSLHFPIKSHLNVFFLSFRILHASTKSQTPFACIIFERNKILNPS